MVDLLTDCRAMKHHLQYGIMQCYLPSDASKCNPSQASWYSFYLLQRDGIHWA